MFHVSCDERSTLTARYLEALGAFTKTGKNMPGGMKSEAWRETTHEVRKACEEALRALNEHREEHGC
jgi:hypothetical protein